MLSDNMRIFSDKARMYVQAPIKLLDGRIDFWAVWISHMIV